MKYHTRAMAARVAEHGHIWWLTFSTKRHVTESDRPCCEHKLQWPVNVQGLLRATFCRVKWPESGLLLAPLAIILMDTGQAVLMFSWPTSFMCYTTTKTRLGLERSSCFGLVFKFYGFFFFSNILFWDTHLNIVYILEGEKNKTKNFHLEKSMHSHCGH